MDKEMTHVWIVEIRERMDYGEDRLRDMRVFDSADKVADYLTSKGFTLMGGVWMDHSNYDLSVSEGMWRVE